MSGCQCLENEKKYGMSSTLLWRGDEKRGRGMAVF